jgi:rubrerythrin
MENNGMVDTTKKTDYGNVDVHELFQIAMKVERNASDFYKKAANLYDNVGVSELFMRLHSWESEHLDVIGEMYSQILQKSRDNENYLPTKIETPETGLMAGLAVFGIHPDPLDKLSGSENCMQAIDLAVRNEKDTVVFFTGLKGFMTDPEGQHNIDSIISEEIRHISHLEQARRQLLDS